MAGKTEIIGGRFELGMRAGAGGMGEVFRARDQQTNTEVAVKRLPPRAIDGIERFLREAQVLSLLSHPAIVRYLGHGTEAGTPWLAMEWLEGIDLETRLQSGARLTMAETIELGARIAEALAAAHAHGIVHRDVKPSNLFLVDNDLRNVRLVDFGIAKPLRATNLTAAGSMLGTIGYLSPEQARGQAVDARSDVFSLGCVLFECVTGRPLFEGDEAIAVLGKLLFESPPKPSDVDPSLAPLDALFASLLAPLPDRPADGQAAAKLLRSSLPSLPPPRVAREITTREQEPFATVLLRLHPAAPTDATQDSAVAEDERRRIEELVSEARGRHEWLADGTMIGLWEIDPARDQVVRAARFARHAVDALKAGAVLATGFAERAGSRAFGSLLDRGARLLGQNPFGHVLLDASSAEILRQRFSIERRGSELALGHEFDVQEIVDRTPFVGRERELGLLAGLFDECVAEASPRAILVTGEPGAGKSRLLREARRRFGPERVWAARGDPMRPGSAYTLFAELLRSALGIGVHDRGLPADLPEFLAHASGLSTGAPSAALRSALADPAMMAARVREAWEAFCVAATARGPVVVLLEDIHWADAPSLKLVEGAVANTDGALFVLAAARPEFHAFFPGAWTSSRVQEVRVAALSRKAAEALAVAIWSEASEEQRRAAVNRAGGSPLWLEELLHHERGGETELPDSIVAVLQARLAKEPADERRALRAAAVFGERAWLDGIAGLMGVPRDEAARIVARLVAKDWFIPVAESRFEGVPELRFRHGLHRDAAYATLTSDDARLGHGLALKWLSEAGERDAVTLAEHGERSATPADAIPHYVRAAIEANHANDLDVASARADRAIALGATGPALIRAQVVKGTAGCWRGRFDEAREVFRHAIDRIEPGDPSASLVSGWTAMVGAMKVDAPLSARAAELLQTVDPNTAMPDEYAQALSYVTSALYFEGERERSDALVLAIDAEKTEGRAGGWNAHSRLQYLRFSVGDTWGELLECNKGMQAFDSVSDGAGLTQMYGQRAIIELSLDNHAGAIGDAERALELAQRFDMPLLAAYGTATRILGASNGAEARARSEPAVTLAYQLGDGVYGMYSLVVCSYALRLRGELELAAEVARNALARPQLIAVEATLRMQLAGALLAVERPEDAAEECLKVVALTQPRHMRGALDLDFMATAATAFARVGQPEASVALRDRATRIIERRALRIDDVERRAAYLSSSFVKRLSAL